MSASLRDYSRAVPSATLTDTTPAPAPSLRVEPGSRYWIRIPGRDIRATAIRPHKMRGDDGTIHYVFVVLRRSLLALCCALFGGG